MAKDLTGKNIATKKNDIFVDLALIVDIGTDGDETIEDDFVDSNTNLAIHTPLRRDGTQGAPDGSVWRKQHSTTALVIDTTNHHIEFDGGTQNEYGYFIDCKSPDGDLYTVITPYKQAGSGYDLAYVPPAFRYTSPSGTGLKVGFVTDIGGSSRNSVVLYRERPVGTKTIIGNAHYTLVNGVPILVRVNMKGDVIKVYIDGTLYIDTVVVDYVGLGPDLTNDALNNDISGTGSSTWFLGSGNGTVTRPNVSASTPPSGNNYAIQVSGIYDASEDEGFRNLATKYVFTAEGDDLSELIPVDVTKTYQVEVWARTIVPDPPTAGNYFLVDFFDADGDAIESYLDTGTGWDSLGTYYYWELGNGTIPTAWTQYTFTFGPHGTGTFPKDTKATYMRLGVLAQYSTPTTVGDVTYTMQFQNLRVREVIVSTDYNEYGTYHGMWLNTEGTPSDVNAATASMSLFRFDSGMRISDRPYTMRSNTPAIKDTVNASSQVDLELHYEMETFWHRNGVSTGGGWIGDTGSSFQAHASGERIFWNGAGTENFDGHIIDSGFADGHIVTDIEPYYVDSTHFTKIAIRFRWAGPRTSSGYGTATSGYNYTGTEF